MNFYASQEFLAVVAEAYFKGRKTSIEDVQVAGGVLRLLVVDDKHVVTSSQFMDYHVPLSGGIAATPARHLPYAPTVVRGTVEFADWERDRYNDFEPAPYLDWSMFPSFDDFKVFIKKRRKGSVQKIERLRRRLVEKVGDLVFSVNDKQDGVFELARQWKSQQLRESGLKDYFADPKNIVFFDLLRDRGLLTSSTLRAADGRLLSVWLGFMHDNVWSGWIFTYDRDPEIAYFSPGHQLVQLMLAESHRRGHREFDFSIGNNEYKSIYATHVRLLGPLGRTPLQQRVLARARQETKNLLAKSPKLYDAARLLKQTVQNYAIR